MLWLLKLAKSVYKHFAHKYFLLVDLHGDDVKYEKIFIKQRNEPQSVFTDLNMLLKKHVKNPKS